ncbi:hypothetical protein BsWGS_15357 [Bradybaena similaris]
MGRPKKGEIAYRKPVKKNGLHLMKGFYDKTISQTRHLSLSSDLEQEEDGMSPCDNVFSSLSSMQQHLLPAENTQMTHHMQPLSRYQGEQQAGAFSLGSLLHDCMTVQDWDHKVEMAHLDHDMSAAHSSIMNTASASSRNNQRMTVDDGQNNQHIKLSSPNTVSDPLSVQLQQSLQHHHHLQQSQNTKGFQQLKGSLQSNHQTVVYHDHTPSTSTHSMMTGDMDFTNKPNFTGNRKIKEEDIQNNTVYTEDVLLADMRNLQTFSKADFQSYTMQGLNLNVHYGQNEVPKLPTVSNSGDTFMPVSTTESNVSAQIGVVNMPSVSTMYTPPTQHGYIINGNSTYHTSGLTQQQQRIVQSNLGQNSGQSQSTVAQLLISGALSSNENNQAVRNQGVRIGAHVNHNNAQSNSNLTHTLDKSMSNLTHTLDKSMSNLTHTLDKSIPSSWSSIAIGDNGNRDHRQSHILTARSHAYNISASCELYDNTQQFASDNTPETRDNACSLVHRSALSRNNNTHNGNENNFTGFSFHSQPTNSDTQTLLNFSDKQSNAHNKFTESRSPINDIHHQSRSAVQATRPVHLSNEDVEELLNSVGTKHERIQSFLINEHAILSERKMDSCQDIVDLRRQPLYNFIVKDEKPEDDELLHCNRKSSPASCEYLVSGQTHQYHQSISPADQDIPDINKTQYRSQISMSSDSSLSDRHELSDGYLNNNNNNISNNNNNHISHYMYQDTFNTRNNQNEHFDDTYEDSFNSALIRDSTLLHEINRIFLGIDNSCDTYGCQHQDGASGNSGGQDLSVLSSMSPDGFSPEISHRYWHGLQPSYKFLHMTPERQKITQDVLEAFDELQKTYVTNDPENLNKKLYLDQLEHWHHIQRKIARHVVAGQRFCRNIPGYFKLDIQDRISLGKHVGFGLMVLIACTEFYDPEFKRFKHIWNWTMPMQNPLFSYKVHLLSLGDRIHNMEIDRTEASLMCAISMTSIDCPNLLNQDIVCEVRDALIDALKAHICTKTEPAMRFKKLMSIMPQVRLMTVWYNNLMKKMSVPSEIHCGKINRPRLADEDETDSS